MKANTTIRSVRSHEGRKRLFSYFLKNRLLLSAWYESEARRIFHNYIDGCMRRSEIKKLLVAYKNHKPVAWLLVYNTAVHRFTQPSQRGQGYSRRLIQKLYGEDIKLNIKEHHSFNIHLYEWTKDPKKKLAKLKRMLARKK